MAQVNYLSDIKILENYPKTDNFVYHFATTEETCYDVSLEIGNCRKDGDYLVICLDNHGLKEGQLKVRREFHFKDDDFLDKEWTKVVEHRYDIYLTEDVDCENDIYVLPQYMPIFKGDKGDAYIITEDDYEEIATLTVSKIDWDEVLKNKQDKLVSGENIKTLNGESLLGSGNIATVKDVRVNNSSVVVDNVANVTVPTVQTSYGDTTNSYINSDGYTDSNKCALSAKNTTIFQGVEGWMEGKLLFRKGRWGDDGFSTIEIPTATKTCNGVLSYMDKQTIDVVPTIKRVAGEALEVANGADTKANFLQGKITDIYNELDTKVKDVQVDGTTVTTSGIANISLTGYQKNQYKANSITSSNKTSNTYYPTTKAVADYVDPVKAKVDEIELSKVPNLTLFGTPTVTQGQISDFSNTNYAHFPFLVNLNKPFELNMCFTTGSNLVEQHNIFDSEFGLALAIRNERLIMAASTNGTSWDLGEHEGDYFTTNTTYYLKFTWDGEVYKLQGSIDKIHWLDNLSFNSNLPLFPKKILIGRSVNGNNNFNGSINLNYCNLIVGGVEVWRGMDSVGLATRLATDLSNIDAEGEAKIKDITKLLHYTETDNSFNLISEYPSLNITNTISTMADIALRSSDGYHYSQLLITPTKLRVTGALTDYNNVRFLNSDLSSLSDIGKSIINNMIDAKIGILDTTLQQILGDE